MIIVEMKQTVKRGTRIMIADHTPDARRSATEFRARFSEKAWLTNSREVK
jgi:hypothetical protein